MALKEVIRLELRQLRKLGGELDAAKMLRTPALLKGLGDGNPSLALNRLLLFSRRYRNDPEILAALSTMGFRSAGETVQDRLEKHALLNGTDSRTVRRWSDAGIEKLASLVLSLAPWIDPKIFLAISMSESDLSYRVQFDVPRGIGMKLPTLTIGQIEQELKFFRVRSNAEGFVYQTDEHPIQAYREAGPNYSIGMQLDCRGEIAPTYILDAHFIDRPISLRSYTRVHSLNVEIEGV